MNHKEKAKELFEKFYHLPANIDKYGAKQCALIAVDEILNGPNVWQFIEGKSRVFWNEVKAEIEKL
jgi:hypothetical protein